MTGHDAVRISSPFRRRACARIMAGMMQTQMAEGNGLCHCRALLLLPSCRPARDVKRSVPNFAAENG
jgi:hypothetical protein